QELLGNGRHIHAAAGSRLLSNDERAIRLGFNDGIADAGEIGNGFPIRLTVSASTLRATFNHVTGNGAGGETVPLIDLPAELADHGAKSQGRVIAAAGDDDSSTLAKRLRDRKCAEVDVSALDARTDRAERLTGIKIGEIDPAIEKLVESWQDVVPR